VRDLWRLLRDTDQSKGDIPDLKKRIHAELAELDKRLATFAPEVGLLPDKPRLKQRCLASVPKYDVSGGGSAPAFGKGAVIYAPAAPPPGF
jgi:hypothetical protein